MQPEIRQAVAADRLEQEKAREADERAGSFVALLMVGSMIASAITAAVMSLVGWRLGFGWGGIFSKDWSLQVTLIPGVAWMLAVMWLRFRSF